MAGQLIEAGVKDVQILGVTYRDTKNGKRVFDVACSDARTYSTFDNDLANKAHALNGQMASIQFEYTKNGQYDNFNLKAIGQQGSLGAATASAQPAPLGGNIPAAGAPAPASTIPAAGGNGGGRGGNMDPEREARIIRGNSLNAVGALFGPLLAAGHFHDGDGDKIDASRLFGSIEQACERFAGYISGGLGAQAPQAPPPATPQAVAEAVNAEVGEAAVQVGAPVAAVADPQSGPIPF